MGTWKAQLGRISLFPAIPAASGLSSALELFKQVWGTEPDSFQKQPVSGLPFTPTVAQGDRNGLSVSCSAQPIRIDFFVTAPASSQSTINLIEDTKQFAAEISTLIDAVVDQITIPCGRAACFTQFSVESESAADANKLMNSIFPKRWKLELSDEEDFILQLNRPELVDAQKVNFITKWAVERVQLLTLQIGPNVASQSGGAQLVSERFVSTITFDNNNVPKTQLSKDELSSVLKTGFQRMWTDMREANLMLEGF